MQAAQSLPRPVVSVEGFIDAFGPNLPVTSGGQTLHFTGSVVASAT